MWIEPTQNLYACFLLNQPSSFFLREVERIDRQTILPPDMTLLLLLDMA